MRKIKTALEYIVAVFYRYYSKGATKDIAFLSAVLAVAFTVMLILMLSIEIFNLDYDKLSIVSRNKGRTVKFLTSGLTVLFFYALVRLGVSKKRVKAYKLDRPKYRRSLYLIFLFIAIIVISLAILIKINA